MTLERGVALIAVHLGIVDEKAIDNMSMLFFEDVLEELGKKLNYDAIVNYAGNSFASDSWKMIQEAYPLGAGKKTGSASIAAFFENATVVVRGSKNVNPEDIGPVK